MIPGALLARRRKFSIATLALFICLAALPWTATYAFASHGGQHSDWGDGDPDGEWDGEWNDPDGEWDGEWNDPDGEWDGEWNDPDDDFDWSEWWTGWCEEHRDHGHWWYADWCDEEDETTPPDDEVPPPDDEVPPPPEEETPPPDDEVPPPPEEETPPPDDQVPPPPDDEVPPPDDEGEVPPDDGFDEPDGGAVAGGGSGGESEPPADPGPEDAAPTARRVTVDDYSGEELTDTSFVTPAPVSAPGWADAGEKSGEHAVTFTHQAISWRPNAGESEAHGNSGSGVAVVVDRFVRSELLRAAVETVEQMAFPLSLTMMVIFFLLVQSRIDRRDPKLALAAITRRQETLSFE